MCVCTRKGVWVWVYMSVCWFRLSVEAVVLGDPCGLAMVVVVGGGAATADPTSTPASR